MRFFPTPRLCTMYAHRAGRATCHACLCQRPQEIQPLLVSTIVTAHNFPAKINWGIFFTIDAKGSSSLGPQFRLISTRKIELVACGCLDPFCPLQSLADGDAKLYPECDDGEGSDSCMMMWGTPTLPGAQLSPLGRSRARIYNGAMINVSLIASYGPTSFSNLLIFAQL
jgi:hypothetical protein